MISHRDFLLPKHAIPDCKKCKNHIYFTIIKTKKQQEDGHEEKDTGYHIGKNRI